MGAFFIYKKDANVDIDAAKTVFKKKGFKDPFVKDICDKYTIMHYKKQLVDNPNYFAFQNSELFVIGTVVYKGMGYKDSVESILKDKVDGSLDNDKLRGNYCLIFNINNKLDIVTDPFNVQHLFTDNKKTYLTSSFLAAIAAYPGKLSLDRNTCVEKLLTGFTVGSETIFNEIQHISRRDRKNNGWNIEEIEKFTIPEAEGTSIEENAKKRAGKICEYLKDFENLKDEYKPELGLSDGFDSRTLYAGIIKQWGMPIDAHTHSTEGASIHDAEKKTVIKITKDLGANLTIVPTKMMSDYSEEEIDNILIDDLYFFDGRCGYNMGAFSPVYTRKYKIATAKDHRFTLNGVGGEVYRNYYCEAKPFFSVYQWMRAHIYSENINKVLDKKTLKNVHSDYIKKIEKELETPWKKVTSNFVSRRVYSEIVTTEADGLNCNAHNQMLFYVAPFVEWDVTRDAYKSRKAVSLCGELEAKIMETLDKRVASYSSHYGFRFTEKPPIQYRIRRFFRGWVPNSIWNYRASRLESNVPQYFEATRKKSKYLQDATKFMESILPEVNFKELRKNYAMMPNSTHISTLLYEFKDKIETI